KPYSAFTNRKRCSPPVKWKRCCRPRACANSRKDSTCRWKTDRTHDNEKGPRRGPFFLQRFQSFNEGEADRVGGACVQRLPETDDALAADRHVVAADEILLAVGGGHVGAVDALVRQDE